MLASGDKQFNLGPINVGQARHTGPLAGPIEVHNPPVVANDRKNAGHD